MQISTGLYLWDVFLENFFRLVQPLEKMYNMYVWRKFWKLKYPVFTFRLAVTMEVMKDLRMNQILTFLVWTRTLKVKIW